MFVCLCEGGTEYVEGDHSLSYKPHGDIILKCAIPFSQWSLEVLHLYFTSVFPP